MISLATIWLKTELMPRWLVAVIRVAVGLLLSSGHQHVAHARLPYLVLVVKLAAVDPGRGHRPRREDQSTG